MKNTAQDIRATLEELTKKVDPAIYELLISSVDEKCQEIARYQISCGGKRIRPALAILSCKMLGGKLEDVLYPSASLEILHNATLLIDDIIDHSDSRRSQPTVWKKFGTSMAECFSMDYIASVFQGANRSSKGPELTEIFAKTLKNIVDGEVDDILFERSGREDEPFIVKNRHESVSQDDYFEMIGKKTATLIQTSCQVGGICAGGNEEQLKNLMNYGWGIGISFQIRDDILDIFGDEKRFGKKIGKDIIEKKLGNIVIILALQDLDDGDKDTILDILNSADTVSDAVVLKAIEIIKKTNAKERSLELGEKYITESTKSLDKLPQNEFNQNLKSFADFMIARKH